MLFLENFARPLLIVHAVAAAVLVGATTHHLLWSRHYLFGRFNTYKGERTFAWVAAAAFVTTFLVGNLLYPTYKVRVRAEYFDSPQAVAAESALRTQQHQVSRVAVAGAPERGLTLTSVARLFDIKEHWVAIGCAASLVLLVLSRRAHPKDHPRVLWLYLGLSATACGAAWFGAVVGLLTASYRAVGGVT
ncbi:MAG TPA: hypothetical protein VFF06_37140 [Polyangia bacterium]|nr:hypothetical protein [Polyangia bacterium]